MTANDTSPYPAKLSRIEFANTLRGIAAFMVIVAHFYGVFWLNNSAAADLIFAPRLPEGTMTPPSYLMPINTIPYLNWGALGVAVFFLISGFVIPISLSKNGPIAFLLSRLVRIWPVYAVGFSLSLGAIWLSLRLYGGDWPFSLQEVLIHYVPGIRDFLWSRNIDGIIWTLEIEMKFYLVVALGIRLFKRHPNSVFLIPALLFAGTMLAFSNLEVWGETNATAYVRALALTTSSQYMIFMFCGTALHFYYDHRIRPEVAFFWVITLCGMFAMIWLIGPYNQSFPVIWNYLFALILFVGAMSWPQLFGKTRIASFLASISYPLYVVHALVGYLALRLLFDHGIPAWVSLITVTIFVCVLAWLIHVAVERPSQQLARKAAERLNSESMLTGLAARLNRY